MTAFGARRSQAQGKEEGKLDFRDSRSSIADASGACCRGSTSNMQRTSWRPMPPPGWDGDLQERRVLSLLHFVMCVGDVRPLTLILRRAAGYRANSFVRVGSSIHISGSDYVA
jgi:hypothetical protein